MFKNIPLMTDSYKAGHVKCYPSNIEGVYSYLESRGGEFKSTLFFGLQYYLMEYMVGSVVTKADVDEAEAFWADHFGRKDYFDRSRWDYIVEKHNGKLPLEIKAVAEGTIVPVSNALMTIENTDPNCFWLTNYMETLLMKVWYPITIATQSRFIKDGILERLKKSGTPESIDFKCHDFGYRGVSSEETAAIGAASHLVSFMGTDTVAGIRLLQKYYGAKMCGFSIPATEHSIMCSFGRENEAAACENLLKQFPGGLIACVSDTYNIYDCCQKIWGGSLKDKVLARDGCLVVRPDSGDYNEVVPKVARILINQFGGTVNNKGYMVLNPKVRIIQGDGMNPKTILELYDTMMDNGFSADNLAVGSGGGLLQKVDRDTCKFAIKASSVKVGGKDLPIWKDPITGSGKASKRGRLALINNAWPTSWQTLETNAHNQDQLQTVFKDGVLTKAFTLDEIKQNASVVKA